MKINGSENEEELQISKIKDLIKSSTQKNKIEREREIFLKLVKERQKFREKPKLLPLRIALVFLVVFIGIWIIFRTGTPPSLTGKSIFLFEPPEQFFIEPGKPTVINFFASWCNPCEDEMPELVRFWQEHKQDVNVIGIPVNDTEENVKRFVKSFNVSFPVLFKDISENQKFFARLGGSSIPMTVILDGEGKIEKVIRGPVTKKTLERILKQIAQKNETKKQENL